VAAELVGVNRNTANRFYFALRTMEKKKPTPLTLGNEVSESR